MKQLKVVMKVFYSVLFLCLLMTGCPGTGPDNTQDDTIDYSPLILNEINGNQKYVEIYNSGDVTIPLKGVKLDRNDGESSWTGTTDDHSIPAKSYRLFLFDNHHVDLTENPANKNWLVASGISAAKTLKIALINPSGGIIDVFIRGQYPLSPGWGKDVTIEDETRGYSRMDDDTWSYADPSPGEKNDEDNIDEIIGPMYLTSLPKDLPVFSNWMQTPALGSVTPDNTVSVSVKVTTKTSSLTLPVTLYWTVTPPGGGGDPDNHSADMSTSGGNVYTAEIPAYAADDKVTYHVVAANSLEESVMSGDHTYTITTEPIDWSKLYITEINGNDKYVEIYNSGTQDIPLAGVRLERNGGLDGDDGVLDTDDDGSEWPDESLDGIVGTGIIEAGKYGLIVFNKGDDHALETDPAYLGAVDSGISAGQYLKVELLAGADSLDMFIRGENPLGAWGDEAEGAAGAYSRKADHSWIYANASPGTGISPLGQTPIVNPGYLTAMPVDPVVFTNVSRTPGTAIVPLDTSVIIKATANTSHGTAFNTPIVTYTINDEAPVTATMGGSGNNYTAVIDGQTENNTIIRYRISATNVNDEISYTPLETYTVTEPVDQGEGGYDNLMLNEVSGKGGDADKFIELYNKGTEPISLFNVSITYKANDDYDESTPSPHPFPPNSPESEKWRGSSLLTIGGGEYFLIKGRNNQLGGVFDKGLTSERNLIIQLKAPDNSVIDTLVRSQDEGEFAISEHSFARIPNGDKSAKFYFVQEPTIQPNAPMGISKMGASNGTNTAGLKALPTGDYTPDPEPATAVVFTKEGGAPAASGAFSSQFQLTLSAGEGNVIYYSIDGTVPSKAAFDAGNPSVKKYAAPFYVQDRTPQPNNLSSAANIQKMYPNAGDEIYGEDDTSYVPSPYEPGSYDVPKGTVVRAVAVDETGAHSPVVTRTYFVGISFNDSMYGYGEHPVFSLVIDPAHLLQDTVPASGFVTPVKPAAALQQTDRWGILVKGSSSRDWVDPARLLDQAAMFNNTAYNFQLKGDTSDRPANLEFFTGGEVKDWQSVSLRVKGSFSRSSAQKSFNVYFGKAYGDMGDLLGHALIPGAKDGHGNQMTSYRNFTLRNGGNDTESTKFLDAYVHDLVQDRNYTTQASVPCIVFINGEYWGPYNLQEKYGDNHINYKYGINGDNYIAYDNDELDDGKEPGDPGYSQELNLFPNARRQYAQADMTVPINYIRFGNAFDIDNMIDYFATEIYVGNEDWPNNNYRVWRVRDLEPANEYGLGDQKWRWQLFDMDAIFGINSDGLTVSEDGKDVFARIFEMDEGGNDALFISLLANEEFSRKFVNTILDLHNTNFSYNSWDALLTNKYIPMWEGLMGNDDINENGGNGSGGYFGRWGFPYSTPEGLDDGYWSGVFDDYVTMVRNYLNAIGDKMTGDYLPTYFGKEGGYQVTQEDSNSRGTVVTIPDLGISGGTGLCDVFLQKTGIKINTVTPGANWTGQYYTGNPITLTAPDTGFTSWVINGGDIVNGAATDRTITVKLNGATTISYN